MDGIARWWTAGLVLAAALFYAGICLRQMGFPGADVPTGADLLQELRDVHGPQETPGAVPLWHGPLAGARVWKLAWVHATGQWDLRVLGVTATGLHSLALAVLLGLLVWRTRPVRGAVVGLLGLAWFALNAGLFEVTAATRTETGLWLLFSLAHVAGTVASAPGSRRWWLAQAAGLVNVLLSHPGLGSPLALLFWAALHPLCFAGEQRRWRRDAAANGALLAVAAGVLASGGGFAPAQSPFSGCGPRLLQVFGWPLVGVTGPLILNLPLVVQAVALASGRRHDARGRALAALSLLAVVGGLAVALLAGRGTGPEIACLVAVANIAVAIDLAVRHHRVSAFVAVTAAIWGLIVAHAQLLSGRPDDTTVARQAARDAVPAAVRAWADGGPAGDAAAAVGLSAEEGRVTASLLAEPRLRALLPVSIRPALRLAPGVMTEAGHLASDGPDRPDRPAGVPQWTVGGAPGMPRTEWVSGPVATAFPLLQVFVTGELRPPESSLALRLDDGREFAPLEAAKRAPDRWKRIHFLVPEGARWRLVARAAAGAPTFAFAAPLERSRASWLAGKVAATWPWLFGAGLAGVAAALATAAAVGRRLAPEPAAPETGGTGVARWAPWGIFVLLVLFAGSRLDTTASGSDASGYLNAANLLREGSLRIPVRGVPGLDAPLLAHLPLGFAPAGGGAMVPTYPLGLPLMIALLSLAGSFEFAVSAVILAHFAAGVLCTRWLARECGLSGGWGWLGAALVGFSPLYFYMAVQPMSDGPALVWVTAAVAAALRSRTDARWSVAAGVATAVAVMVRPANALCAVPVVLAFGMSPRRWGGWILGGLPGAVWQLWANQRLYGRCLTTGYGDVGALFATGWVGPTLRHYAVWLPVVLTPLVLAALVAPWLRGVPGRTRLVLGAWVAVFFAFYASYYCTHEAWWYLRFVLPALPPLAVFALLAVRAGAERAGWNVFDAGAAVRAVSLAPLLLGLPVTNALLWSWKLPVFESAFGNRWYRDTAEWAASALPGDAVVVAMQASGTLAHYTRFPTIRYDLVSPEELAGLVGRTVALGRPVYAILQDGDREHIDGRLPGRWTRIRTTGSLHVLRHEGPAEIPGK